MSEINLCYPHSTRRPYSFGLGKRAGLEIHDDGDVDSQENGEPLGYDSWQINAPHSELVHPFDAEGICGLENIYRIWF